MKSVPFILMKFETFHRYFVSAFSWFGFRSWLRVRILDCKGELIFFVCVWQLSPLKFIVICIYFNNKSITFRALNTSRNSTLRNWKRYPRFFSSETVILFFFFLNFCIFFFNLKQSLPSYSLFKGLTSFQSIAFSGWLRALLGGWRGIVDFIKSSWNGTRCDWSVPLHKGL